MRSSSKIQCWFLLMTVVGIAAWITDGRNATSTRILFANAFAAILATHICQAIESLNKESAK